MTKVLGILKKTKGKEREWYDRSEPEEEPDRPLTLRTQFSAPVQFNTLHVPKLQRLHGNYNYYVETENNDEYNETKDLEAPADAPMFVALMWETIHRLELAPTVPSTSTFHDVEIEGLSTIRLRDVRPANPEIMSGDSTIIITR